jgi:hypothetical protein
MGTEEPKSHQSDGKKAANSNRNEKTKHWKENEVNWGAT